jgi:hypothetical protein
LATSCLRAKGLRRWINHLRGNKERRYYNQRLQKLELVPDLTQFPEGFRRLALSAYVRRRQALARKLLSFWRDYLDTSMKHLAKAETFRDTRITRFASIVIK